MPWQPPSIRPNTPPPVGGAPQFSPLVPVGTVVLVAPLWGHQPTESPLEFHAFSAWLMGGYELARPVGRPAEDARVVTRGDWGAAIGVSGTNRAAVEAMAARWSWEVRGREYWTTVRAIGEQSAKSTEQTLLEYAALARELDRKWLELSILEVDKAIVEARRIEQGPGEQSDPRFLPRLFTNRELIQLRRADGALEVQRARAGILERRRDTDDVARVDWAQLPPADLETYRKLRELARAQAR